MKDKTSIFKHSGAGTGFYGGLAFYLAEHFLYHRANFPGDIKNGDADFSASPFFHPILMFWFPKDLLYLIHAPSAPTVYPSVVVVPAAMDPNGPPLTVLKKYHLPPISCQFELG